MGMNASRDLGLERIRKTTRLAAVGALLAGGVLSAAVAKSLPGKSTHGTSGSPAPSNAGGGGDTTSGQSTGSGSGDTSTSTSQSAPDTSSALSPPTQAPQPTFGPPVVSSGGS
jgi:hypothetical protein